MATNKNLFDVFPGAKVVDPKDMARRSNIPAKVEKPQDREAHADDGIHRSMRTAPNATRLLIERLSHDGYDRPHRGKSV